jgi:hypothetical protein
VSSFQEALQIDRKGCLYGLGWRRFSASDAALGGLELDDDVARQLLVVAPGGQLLLILLLTLH